VWEVSTCILGFCRRLQPAPRWLPIRSSTIFLPLSEEIVQSVAIHSVCLREEINSGTSWVTILLILNSFELWLSVKIIAFALTLFFFPQIWSILFNDILITGVFLALGKMPYFNDSKYLFLPKLFPSYGTIIQELAF